MTTSLRTNSQGAKDIMANIAWRSLGFRAVGTRALLLEARRTTYTESLRADVRAMLVQGIVEEYATGPTDSGH